MDTRCFSKVISSKLFFYENDEHDAEMMYHGVYPLPSVIGPSCDGSLLLFTSLLYRQLFLFSFLVIFGLVGIRFSSWGS